jgi:hypothetical protein
MRYVRKTPLPKDGKRSEGRPPIIEGDVLQKLVDAFSLGCTDEEACIYVDISMSTLYDYQERHPEFAERKKLLKQKPFLKARNTVVGSLGDPDHAEWYLERKGKDEFSTRSSLALSGRVEVEESINKIIEILNTEIPEDCPHCKKFIGVRDSVAQKLSALSLNKNEN